MAAIPVALIYLTIKFALAGVVLVLIETGLAKMRLFPCDGIFGCGISAGNAWHAGSFYIGVIWIFRQQRR